MSTNIVSSRVLDAASVVLSKPVKIHGMNTYVLSSDFISWNETFNHTLSNIAQDFGRRVSGVGDKVFTCGDDKISVYDFGLLFTVFTAMTTAKAELGDGFPVEEVETSKTDVHALWVGNDLIVYSVVRNVILPVDNAEVESACGGTRLECSNFCSSDVFLVDRERVEMFVVDAVKKELFCRFRIGSCTQKCYSKHFVQPEEDSKDILATWDTESKLGKLIASVGKSGVNKDIFKKYRKKVLEEQVATRSDLFVKPEKRYTDLNSLEDLRKIFGTVCYTDKEEAAIAVNYRAGMFLYSPCFPGDGVHNLYSEASPKLDRFYDITDGCERIMRYANTVVQRPLTSAQLDIKVFNLIANALVDQKLKRLPFTSCLGRVVIPESVLEYTFETGFGADLFCIVPVGVIGSIVVCKTAEGNLEAVYPRGWDINEAFYDITEVVNHVEH